ncbi:MAG: ABC transporter ATP-binding protein [Clostridiales bacterium]|nr:ABC transporter ATP-binding protein [Clostridiales bacterium]
MIKANGIYKSFNGGEPILKDVSVDIADGEFAVILGASGSGKSTLLSVLSGLEKMDSGTVFCDGQELSAMTDKQLTFFRRKSVGFIFQQYYLLEHMNVENNVRLGADLASNKDYRETIAAVGLADRLKAKPSELSGGEQQRVCIARALAKNPRVLFSDEPTGALDEQTGRSVLDYMIKLKRERGFTMVMVTHNRNIAETADTVIKMNSGRIVEVTKNSVVKSAYDIEW